MTRRGRGPHGDDAQEASLRLVPEDALEDVSTDDVLELGYSPEDRPWAVDDWGTTGFEEEQGGSLDGRLAREVPDVADGDPPGDDLGDVAGGEGELLDDEVGDRRAGRLAATDAGTGSAADPLPALEAFDEGIDGGGASSEEAAVHVVADGLEENEEAVMSAYRMVYGDDRQEEDRPTVGQVMRPATTTVERDAHLAAATYLFKKAGDTALVVVDDEAGMRPIAVITDADVAQAVADGRDPNDVRINSVVSRDPMTVARETGVAEAAELMLDWQLTHLPVVDGTHLVGIVDMNAVCRGLLGTRAGGG